MDVHAKQRQYAFDLSGKSNVTIQNVNLFATSINMDALSTNNTLDGINAQYVSHFTTLPDVVSSPHSYWYDHNTDSGIVLNGTGNVLENSTITCGAGNDHALQREATTRSKNNLIQYFHYIANNLSGITFTFQAGSGNKIELNTIQSGGEIQYSVQRRDEVKTSATTTSFRDDAFP